MFGFLRRRKKERPVEVFDRWIALLGKQGEQLRRSAAALLASRGELRREVAAWRTRTEDGRGRRDEAASRGDLKLEHALAADVRESELQVAELEAELAKTEADAELLLEAADEVRQKLALLNLERAQAERRLQRADAIEAAWREHGARFEQLLAVDAARDEVERAHALAELYREQLGNKS